MAPQSNTVNPIMHLAAPKCPTPNFGIDRYVRSIDSSAVPLASSRCTSRLGETGKSAECPSSQLRHGLIQGSYGPLRPRARGEAGGSGKAERNQPNPDFTLDLQQKKKEFNAF